MMRLLGPAGWMALGSVVAACSDVGSPQSQPVQAVRVATLQAQPDTSSVTLTGAIAARVESNLAFRTSGNLVERLKDVGDRVQGGEVLARIDDTVQKANVEAARASVAAAEAQGKQASAAFARIEKLLREGYTTRREYDAALAALKVAQAAEQSANARLQSALESLSFTALKADSDGVITAREADTGETVQAATTVFKVAQDGPRDAVFDTYEALLLRGGEPPKVVVSLVSDPTVTTEGRVRQVTPSVDLRTGTVRVKVELEHVPDHMTLGAAVTGTGALPMRPVFVLPASAMTALAGKPAVWVVDPASDTVAMQAVHVAAYEATTIVIDNGLSPGNQVAVDGTKLLRPGQKVVAIRDGATP